MSKGKLIAGIDVGSDKICTIIASPSEDSGNCNVLGVASTPSAGIRKSQIVDLEEAIAAITDSVEAAERMAGFTINGALVSISGAHIESQNSKGVVAVAQPEGEITPHDVERVIEAARAVSLPSSREIIHVVPRDFVVDSQQGIKDPVGMTGVRLEAEAHLVTGSSTAIRNMTKAISELGIQVQGLVFSGLASSYSVLSETEKELGVILVDIGAGTTSITVFSEGTITYSSVIPIGARNITNDLAIGMRISLASAEKVKTHLSRTKGVFVPPKGVKASEIAKLRKDHDSIDLVKMGIKEETNVASRKALVEGIVQPRLNEIFSLIAEDLKKAKLTGNTPAGIVVTGGGAETVAVIEAAKRILSLPARIGVPKGLTGLVDELHSPVYATAAGLVFYALKNSTGISQASHKFDLKGSMPKIDFKSVIQKLTDLVKSVLP